MTARSRLPYTPCKLFYDSGALLEAGHYLRTSAGSAYLVQTVRINRRRTYRKHLDCVRWPLADIPAGAVVHPLIWYSRNRKSGRTLSSFHVEPTVLNQTNSGSTEA